VNKSKNNLKVTELEGDYSQQEEMESCCEYGDEALFPITGKEESEFGFQAGLLLGPSYLLRCTFASWQRQKTIFL
jgi:hypothetical protein